MTFHAWRNQLQAPKRSDDKIRAFQQGREHSAAGKLLIDVRSPEEYTGRIYAGLSPKARCVAATSRERGASRGRAPRIRTEASRTRLLCAPYTSRKRVSRKATISWRTAALARGPRIRGSFSRTCSATIACGTTTAAGRSGATPFALRSRRVPRSDRTRAGENEGETVPHTRQLDWRSSIRCWPSEWADGPHRWRR